MYLRIPEIWKTLKDLTIWLFDEGVRQGKKVLPGGPNWLSSLVGMYVLLNAIVLVFQILAYSFVSKPVQISVSIFVVIRQSWNAVKLSVQFTVHCSSDYCIESLSVLLILGTIQVLRHHVFDFLGPPTPLMIYSTVNHQKLSFSDPTHPPLWWRNTWMVP